MIQTEKMGEGLGEGEALPQIPLPIGIKED
jgi:hypothetical protein